MTDPLHPSPQLLEKLAGIVHTVYHDHHDTPVDRLCRDPEVIAWAKEMMEIGLLPEPGAAKD